MTFHIVIPARYGSTRLPGKPLLDLDGLPMIVRVYHSALAAGAASVTVATDDARVAQAAESAGAPVVMTRADHPSGTDRLQEVAERLQLPFDAVIVNVQGDEPLLPGAAVRQVAQLLTESPTADMATLCEPLQPGGFKDPNTVKVVCDAEGFALYFSRAPIPWPRDSEAAGAPEAARRHIGLYAYRAALLHRFVGWAEAPLERIEKLEQLRVLHHGGRIRVADACEPIAGGVDTAADLERVRAHLQALGAPRPTP